jgi:hypothetical protein
MVLRLNPNENTMWFVYQGTRSGTQYLGPYSSREFVERNVAGEFDDSVFIWTHGMDDWQQLSKHPELELFFLELKASHEMKAKRADTKSRPQELEITLSNQFDALDFVNIPNTELSYENSAFRKIEKELAANNPATEAATVNEPATVEVDNSLRARAVRHRVPLAVAFIAITASTWFAMSPGKTPLPRGTVASEELDELTRAKSDSLRFSGASAAIAVSKSDLMAPSFYIATNLPNDSKLEIKIEGLAETLVDRFRYSMRATLTVKDGLAQTPPLHDADGGSLKRGAYKLTVTEKGQSKILAQKIYFLGGPQDLTYQAELNRFHKNIRTQAAVELEEITQLNETVAHQISESNARFSEIIRDPNLNGPSRRYRWSKFQQSWNMLTTQFVAIVDSWTPTKIENEFYYGVLYAKLQRASALMSTVHAAQTKRLEPDADRSALDAAIARDSLSAQSLVEEIRSDTERLKLKSGQTNSGSSLPYREDGT